jgi:hypothetical protein
MKIFKKIWKFSSEISGVIATLGIVFFSMNYVLTRTIELLKTNLVFAVLLLVFFVGAIVFLFYLTRERILNFILSSKKESLNENLIHLVEKNNEFDFIKLIPAEKFFYIAKELSLQDGTAWSKDAKISVFNFYIERINENIDLRIQIFLFSEWKSEKMDVYYPSLSVSYEKIVYSEHELKKYFFEFPKWREAILRAYEKISSKISNEFHLQISSQKDNFSINFSFMIGKVKETIHFTFDGNILFCTQDKSRISI